MELVLFHRPERARICSGSHGGWAVQEGRNWGSLTPSRGLLLRLQCSVLSGSSGSHSPAPDLPLAGFRGGSETKCDPAIKFLPNQLFSQPTRSPQRGMPNPHLWSRAAGPAESLNVSLGYPGSA